MLNIYNTESITKEACYLHYTDLYKSPQFSKTPVRSQTFI